MVIADDTDEAAMAKWKLYRDGVDEEAISWLKDQARRRHRSTPPPTSASSPRRKAAVNLNMGTLVGSYATSRGCWTRCREVPGTAGVLLTFDDFEKGIEDFGQKIQPLMTCRVRREERLTPWPHSRSPATARSHTCV